MAAATISIEQDQFCCSVCLEVLRDPVTIPCGHSYCLGCIEDYWDRNPTWLSVKRAVWKSQFLWGKNRHNRPLICKSGV
uniref:RING-type domain-containing protein n=1 Tax=Scophthalmus maximus TaxID=52904 RepID=A0A8D3D2Z5_SCOMX